TQQKTYNEKPPLTPPRPPLTPPKEGNKKTPPREANNSPPSEGSGVVPYRLAKKSKDHGTIIPCYRKYPQHKFRNHRNPHRSYKICTALPLAMKMSIIQEKIDY
ncbi:MAG: hypothetical protein LBC74_05505, partial [Planctomycetaceae bacterium]|nr:hypothetical protein [Planctomycetaceae bacterium]